MFFLIFIYDHAEYFPPKQNPPLISSGIMPIADYMILPG